MNTKIFTLDRIQSYKNMPDLIAEALKDAILQGEYRGGVQLKQDEIAKQFEVSLIPVREALIQVEAKGLVKCIRNKGALVTNMSFKEMEELFEVRKVFEVGCIDLMEDTMDKEALHKLKFIIEKMKTPESSDVYCRHYRLFYQVFCDFAQNKELSKMYEEYFVRIERYLVYIYHLIPELMNELSHQKEMVQALEAEDKQNLVHLVTYHIHNIQETFIDWLEQEGLGKDFDWNRFLPFPQLED
ncbi:MAG: GntR family transcriptional regulator [Niameybacter sp.]|uniref:GntR family transcriptional regulator n=1 Tax=Niameybacter sp. TaxID=2033640 RepID=UPI002FC9349A